MTFKITVYIQTPVSFAYQWLQGFEHARNDLNTIVPFDYGVLLAHDTGNSNFLVIQFKCRNM